MNIAVRFYILAHGVASSAFIVSIRTYRQSSSWLSDNSMFCLEMFSDKKRPRLVYALRKILSL